MPHIPPAKYSSPNRPTKKQTRATQKSHTKEPTFREKMDVQRKRDQENGPKAQKDKTETATGLARQKNKRAYIKKWDHQTDSPEIPDRGETSDRQTDS